MSVDLPEPDGPMIATYSPRSILIDTPRRAWISSDPMTYVFQRFVVEIRLMIETFYGAQRLVVPARRHAYYLASRKRCITARTDEGVSGGNRASQSLTSTGTSTGPALRDRRRCSVTPAASSPAGASETPSRSTHGTPSPCAFSARGHTSAMAPGSTCGTNRTINRTPSSPLRKSPFFGFDTNTASKPVAGDSLAPSTASTASRSFSIAALLTKSELTPVEVGRGAAG